SMLRSTTVRTQPDGVDTVCAGQHGAPLGIADASGRFETQGTCSRERLTGDSPARSRRESRCAPEGPRTVADSTVLATTSGFRSTYRHPTGPGTAGRHPAGNRGLLVRRCRARGRSRATARAADVRDPIEAAPRRAE